MDDWSKVGIFILFLIALYAWIYASNKSLSFNTTQAAAGRFFLSQQQSVVMGLFSFFGFIWILSGFFSLKLFVLVLVAMEVGFLFSGILWALLGSPKVPWSQLVLWEGAQMGVRHPWIYLIVIGFGLLVVIGFPITAGISYFGNTIPSPEGTLAIFKTVISFLLVLGLALGLQMNAMLLASETLHEDVRARVLVMSLGSVAVTGLWVSMAFWAFGIAGQGQKASFGDVTLTLSPIVILSLILFYLVASVGPYFAGVQRAKAFNQTLREKETSCLDGVIEVLQFPAKLEDRVASLEQLREQIDTAGADFIDQRPGLQLAREIETLDDDASSDLQAVAKAYRETRELDSRLAYLHALSKYKDEVGTMIDTLQETDKENELTVTENYAKAYVERRKELQTKSVAKETKPALLIGIGVVVAPISSPILNQVGKWALEILSGEAPSG